MDIFFEIAKIGIESGNNKADERNDGKDAHRFYKLLSDFWKETGKKNTQNNGDAQQDKYCLRHYPEINIDRLYDI